MSRRSNFWTDRPRPTRIALVTTLLTLGSLACGQGPDASEQRAALQERRLVLLTRFAAAQNSVRRTQAQALEASTVVELRERFYGLLRERMIEIDPGVEESLDRARELGPALDSMSQPRILKPGEEPPSVEEQAALADEFAELEQALRPLQRRAMTDPQVAEAFAVLQDSVHAAMVRLNPGAKQTLARMESLSAQVDSIDARLRALPDE